MKLSEISTIIASIITFGLIIFIIGKVLGTTCFSWVDYIIMFSTLFGNLLINILAALGR